MKKIAAILSVALVCVTLLGDDLSAQTLFSPGGAVGNSGSGSTNVGIGTSTPSGKLHIQGNNNNTDIIVNAQSGGAADSSLRIIRNGIGAEELRLIAAGGGASGQNNLYLFDLIGNPNVRDLSFRSSINGGSTYTDLMRLTATGSLGIGTTTPDEKLEVLGNIHAMNGRLESTSSAPEGGNINLLNSSKTGATANSWVIWNMGAAYGNGLSFWRYYSDGTNAGSAMWIADSGNVGIGTTTPTQKLSVNGSIRAKEIIVDNTGWPDYVFEKSYRLAPLSELEQQIKTDKHLPGIPSAQEIAEHGVNMGEMQAKLLAKVEELTLHLIDLEKQVSTTSNRVQHLESENTLLKRALAEKTSLPVQ